MTTNQIVSTKLNIFFYNLKFISFFFQETQEWSKVRESKRKKGTYQSQQKFFKIKKVFEQSKIQN